MLGCRAVGYPDPRVQWKHGNQEFAEHDNQFELTLENVRVEDAGQWSCLVSNECGEPGANELRFQFQLVVSSTRLSRRSRCTEGKRRILVLAERTLFQ